MSAISRMKVWSAPLSGVHSNDLHMARWLRQVNTDPTLRSLARLTEEQEQFGALLWEFRREGEELRRNVLYTLDRYYNGGRAQFRDPRDPAAPYSPRRIIYTACQTLGFEYVPVTPTSGVIPLQEDYADGLGLLPLAWLQTYSAKRSPDMVIDEQPHADPPGTPPHLPIYRRELAIHTGELRLFEYPWWCLHAAQVIAAYYHDKARFTGDEAPSATILPRDPRRDLTDTVLAHRFQNALLGMPTECGPGMSCSCNLVLTKLRQAPENHPGMTGELPPRRDVSHPSQHTPPAGIERSPFGPHGPRSMPLTRRLTENGF